MPDLSGWDDDDISRIGACTAEILDLDRRHPGDLDPGLIATAATLAADALRAQESREPGGQRM